MEFFNESPWYGEPYPRDDEPTVVDTSVHTAEMQRIGDQIATLLNPGAAAERYQVVVHVDAAVLADAAQPGQSVLDDGANVPAETSQRLACDSSRVLMTHDADGRTVEIAARTRAIPPALRRALEHRDRSCRFPGLPCPRRSRLAARDRRWEPLRSRLGARCAASAVESHPGRPPAGR